MATKKKYWLVNDYYLACKLASSRNVYIWGEKKWVTIEVIGGLKYVVDDQRSRAKLKLDAPEHATFKQVDPLPKPAKTGNPVETKASGSVGPRALEFKEIEPVRPVFMKRRPFKMATELVLVHEKVRLVKNHKAAAKWLGLTMTELEARHLPFMLVDGQAHLLATCVEELKSELDVDERLAA